MRFHVVRVMRLRTGASRFCGSIEHVVCRGSDHAPFYRTLPPPSVFAGRRILARKYESARPGRSFSASFFKSIADAIQRLDHVKIVVAGFELLTQALDMAVDGPVVDIDLIVVGSIHQSVAALHHTRPAGERLEDQKFGDGECNR